MSVSPYYVPPAGRALLDAVAYGETRGDYALRYGDRPGHGSITDFSVFPTGVHNGNNVAGKYQFKPGTWKTEARKLGLTDFSPKSQDAAAWDLMKTLYSNRYNGRDLEADLEAGKTSDVIRSLRGTWPSLPGGSQEVTSSTKFDSVYSQALATHSAEAQTPDASTALGQVNLLARGASQGVDAHVGNVEPGTTPSISAYAAESDYNPDYPNSDAQHGNDITDPSTLDNPGPVTSSDLDPFMNAAITHLMASAGPLIHVGSTNGEINSALAQAKDSTYKPDQIIKVDTVNPRGEVIGNVYDNTPLPAPLPLTTGIAGPSHGTIDASGSVIPNPTASAEAIPQRRKAGNDQNEITDAGSENTNDGAITSVWNHVADLFGPQSDLSSIRGSDTRDTHSTTSAGPTGYMKTTGSAGNELLSSVRPSIPDLPLPANYHGSPDDRDFNLQHPPDPRAPNSVGSPDDRDSSSMVHFLDPNTIAPHDANTISTAVAAGIDPLTASVVTASGTAPTIIRVPVVRPLVASPDASESVLPNLSIPSYDIGTVRDRNGTERRVSSTGSTIMGIKQGPGPNGTAGEGTIYNNPTKYGETSDDRQAYQQSRQDFLKQWNVT